MIQRSTRVLAHPDGSYTVQFTHELRVSDGRELALPKTVKQWVDDPGFAVQPGFVGQHAPSDRDGDDTYFPPETRATRRAEAVSEAPTLEELYASFGMMFIRHEDETPQGLVN